MFSKIVETNLKFNGPLSTRAETRFIVVHHLGPMPSSMKPEDIGAAWIHQVHIERHWCGIGYHYVIKRDGVIERGRPKDALGAQCESHNHESIGINVVGDFNIMSPTPGQRVSLINLLADLCHSYNLMPGEETIVGHLDKESPGYTECPGLNLYKIMPDIREEVGKLLV